MNFRDIFLLFLTVMFTASAEAQNVPADSFKRFIEGQTFIEKAVFEVTEFMGLAPGKEPKRYFFLLRSEPGSYVLRGSKRLESLSNDQIQTSDYFLQFMAISIYTWILKITFGTGRKQSRRNLRKTIHIT